MGALHRWRRFAADERGVAAVEMALVGTLILGALLNVVEVGRYAYLSTQVTSASQAGAYAAIAECSTTETPITKKCPEATAAMEAAIEGTSLGEEVALKEGGIKEGWYCVAADDGRLQRIANASDVRPVNCAEVDAPNKKPGLYITVQVTYEYTPIFPGLTLTEAFSPDITRSAWMRVL